MRIHSTAIIDSTAILGEGVEIGPFSIVYANVRIGVNACIGSHCEIGYPTPKAENQPLIIGANALIRSHSVFYEGSTFGDGLSTGHHVTVREKITAGSGLQIGTLSDFQGHSRFGDYVKTHSNVHIGQRSNVGNYVWIFPYVVLTNDPHPPSEHLEGVTVQDYAVVATMSVVLPGVTVGEGALVAASSVVSKDALPHRIVAGAPATDRGPTSKIKLRDGTERSAYPWTTHFHRGYPAEIVEQWKKNSSE